MLCWGLILSRNPQALAGSLRSERSTDSREPPPLLSAAVTDWRAPEQGEGDRGRALPRCDVPPQDRFWRRLQAAYPWCLSDCVVASGQLPSHRNDVWGHRQHKLNPHRNLGFQLTSGCLGIRIPLSKINNVVLECCTKSRMSGKLGKANGKEFFSNTE